jgi:hypothetical protein
MKIKIPFIRKYIEISKSGGSSTSNGNGYKHNTISFSIFTILGSGDNGNRGPVSK